MGLQSNFPALFYESDLASERAQNAFYRMSGVRLFALCIAGVLAEIARREAAIGVAIVFGIALTLELIAFLQRPERVWYGERAAAESVKTLAWRYSVAAEPFAHDVSDVDALFAQRLQEVAGKPGGATDAMTMTRSASLDERRDLYKRERLDDQLQWYSRNARSNARLARLWSVVLVVVEAGAFVAAILRAMGRIDFDLFGIVGAVGAAVAAWMQTRQHESLSAAYNVATQELGIIASRIDAVQDERAWASFVADAEKAMSREHTMWRATHA